MLVETPDLLAQFLAFIKMRFVQHAMAKQFAYSRGVVLAPPSTGTKKINPAAATVLMACVSGVRAEGSAVAVHSWQFARPVDPDDFPYAVFIFGFICFILGVLASLCCVCLWSRVESKPSLPVEPIVVKKTCSKSSPLVPEAKIACCVDLRHTIKVGANSCSVFATCRTCWCHCTWKTGIIKKAPMVGHQGLATLVHNAWQNSLGSSVSTKSSTTDSTSDPTKLD